MGQDFDVSMAKTKARPNTDGPHPLSQLSADDFTKARDLVVKQYESSQPLFFRSIYLDEPKRADLVPFLEAEHAGTLGPDTPRPARLARVEYDVIKPDFYGYTRAIVDLGTLQIVSTDTYERTDQAYFTVYDLAPFS